MKTHVIPQYTSYYLCQSWTTSCIFYNAETQQHHASQSRRMQLPLKTIRKRLLTVILISSGILH